MDLRRKNLAEQQLKHLINIPNPVYFYGVFFSVYVQLVREYKISKPKFFSFF